MTSLKCLFYIWRPVVLSIILKSTTTPLTQRFVNNNITNKKYVKMF
jgi:hypothetical protein